MLMWVGIKDEHETGFLPNEGIQEQRWFRHRKIDTSKWEMCHIWTSGCKSRRRAQTPSPSRDEFGTFRQVMKQSSPLNLIRQGGIQQKGLCKTACVLNISRQCALEIRPLHFMRRERDKIWTLWISWQALELYKKRPLAFVSACLAQKKWLIRENSHAREQST